MGFFNSFTYNKKKYNQGEATFWSQLDQQLDTKPVVKIEFITREGVAYDITEYYISGANIERVKERAPDEIQAGDFDLVVTNYNDYFSEYKPGSLLYGIVYHGAKIRIWAGFELPDGRTELKIQQVGYIDELHSSEGSEVTFRCRDVIRKIIDEKFHAKPASETPVNSLLNTGNGTCSQINTKPFKTVNEDWTLTCTVAGDNGTAEFSVIGSVSGNVGTAISGTEFSTGNTAGGIKFTINGGSIDWEIGDVITFSTKQYPEWNTVNPGKIIWSVLTGYNWDSGLQENWNNFVFHLDNTKNSSNTAINYQSFEALISEFSSSDALTGCIPYNTPAVNFLETILIVFLGGFFTDGEGRIKVKSSRPSFANAQRNYADAKKIISLDYNRSVTEIINQVSVKYKSTNNWEFSDEDINYDGIYAIEDSESVDQHGNLLFEFELPWYTGSGVHAKDFSNRLINKYAQPPLVIEFTTGLDALISEIGDHITITDEKSGFSELGCEVARTLKVLDGTPKTVEVTARRDQELDFVYGFLGSRVDEGDGLSPQASTFGTASDDDKQFCYLTTGYRMY